MYVTVGFEEDGSWAWVSGVFTDEKDARKYLSSMKGPVRVVNHLSKQRTEEYPLFIVEAPRLMMFKDSKGIVEFLDGIIDGDPHLTLYRVDEDWTPSVPGVDEMGAMSHVHIDKEALKVYQAGGLDELFGLA